jgi:Zn-dependent M16 (insulinase) family peptidase
MGSELMQTTFSIGLKDISAADASKVEEIVLSVLQHHAEHGFTEDAVSAAMNTIEFQLRCAL